MTGHGYRKQVFLFLAAVLLPCLVLVALTLRMVGQERELARQRAVEERRREARDFGQALLVRLENLKLLEVAAATDRSRIETAPIVPLHPEVALVSAVEGRTIVLPWEADPAPESAKRLLTERGFSKRIQQAERAEFERKDARRAAELYEHILEDYPDPTRNAYTRLLLARARHKANLTSQALEHYRDLLKTPPGVMDEYGIPFGLYAARRLFDLGQARETDWNGLREGIMQRRFPSPSAAHFLLDLLKDSQVDAGQAEKIIATIEQAAALKREFPLLPLGTERGRPESQGQPLWLAYGEPPWLVSISPAFSADRSFLVAVEARPAIHFLNQDEGFAQRFPMEFAVSPESDSQALSPGPGFRGLKLRFLGDPESIPADPGGIRPAFYVAALLLILGIASLGAYFLWRDVRREVRMAELRSQFVSGVSHELKTPLTAIRMFAETLRLGRSKDRRSEEEYLDTIVNESQRLTRLLNNVLDFSKMEKGKRPYRMERISASEVIRAAARAMDYPLRQQGYHLRVRSEEDLPDLWGDRDALEQAVLNLLHNAMKYSGDARDIDLELVREGPSLLIQVRDQGVGIEAKEQKKIFEKFYRVPSPENERLPGAGLGLALVASIVKAHGGSLKVESAPGEGSTFTLILPLMEAR